MERDGEWLVPFYVFGFFVCLGTVLMMTVPPLVYFFRHYVGPFVHWWLQFWLT